MDGAAWTAVASIGGGLVGAGGALFGQLIANRHADRRAADERAATEARIAQERADAQRLAWESACDEFRSAAIRAEAVCGRSGEVKAEAAAVMWATCRRFALVSSDHLREKTWAYATKVNEALWQDTGHAPQEHTGEAGGAFDEAAKGEHWHRWPGAHEGQWFEW